MIFIKESNGSWWELNKDKMEVFSFEGGFHNISDEQLRSLETCECDNWHDLFVLTGWCPLEVIFAGQMYGFPQMENSLMGMLTIIEQKIF